MLRRGACAIYSITFIPTAFYKLLKQFEDVLGKQYTDEMRIDWDHGEPVIAFEILLDNLQEQDVEVDTEARQELRRIAEALDKLDDDRGKGVYW